MNKRLDAYDAYECRESLVPDVFPVSLAKRSPFLARATQESVAEAASRRQLHCDYAAAAYDSSEHVATRCADTARYVHILPHDVW